MRWLVQYARERSEKRMAERLAAELMDATNNQGNSVKDAKTRIAWQKPTRRLHIIVGRICIPSAVTKGRDDGGCFKGDSNECPERYLWRTQET